MSNLFAGFRVKELALPNKERKPGIDVRVLREAPVRRPKAIAKSIVKGMYNVRKAELDPAMVSRIKKDMTLAPKASSMGQTRMPYILWAEKGAYLQVPRFYGIKVLGMPWESRLTDGEPMASIPLNTAPRGYQEGAIRAVGNVFSPTGEPGSGALLEAGCGLGKTFCAIEIARRHGRRTAVVVHKGDLQDQFVERVRQYCPTATVGVVRRDTIETENDFVVFMAQSIVAGKYGPEVFAPFGLVIIDECHHWVAATLSTTLSKFPARCVLGLTATPDRKDGLGYALPYFFGPTAVKMSRTGEIVHVRIVPVRRGKAREVIGRNGRPILATTVTMMCEDEARNKRIVEDVVALRKAGRHIIVMGERRKHLVLLQGLLREALDCPVGLYVGETTKKGIARREAEKDSPVLLATTRMAEEGMDVPRLDCLMLVTPKSNITQAVGRIQRRHKDKTEAPLIVDYYDTYCGGAMHGMMRARRRFYESNKYKLLGAVCE